MHVPANIPTPKTGLEYLPGKLPSCQIPADTDLNAVAKDLLARLPNCPADFFTEDCLYRDMLAMTQSIRTIYGGERARATWLHLCGVRKPTNFEYVEDSAYIAELGGDNNRYIFAAFTFDTTAGGLPASHLGFLNIVPGPNGPDSWQVWSLQTLMENVQGHEMTNLRKVYPDAQRDIEPSTDVGLAINRSFKDYIQAKTQKSGANGVQTNGQAKANGHANGTSSRDDDTRRVDVIIVGAGQAGLNTAGYCKGLDLDAVIIEKNKEVGDNWTNRYEALYLHTPHRFNDLAFGPTFNDKEYSEWLTAAELKKGYQYYAKRYDIDVWLSSNLKQCTYDKEKQEWTAHVNQNGRERTLIGSHLVLAIGSGGSRPLMPQYPGMENFKGKVMHSVEWKSGKAYKGKKALVIGTANTAHDVAESLEEAGADVTMVQRDRTYVIPRDFMTGFLNFAWPEHSQRSQDISDRLFWAVPTAASRAMCYNLFNPQFDAAPELFDGLEKAGFACDRRGDFIDHLLVRFGGHYMNHGASEKIIEGRIKVKGKAHIAAFTETGLEFTDGTKLDADLVVFATGFEKDLTVAAQPFLGAEVASELDEFWGIDEEGEHRGAFVPCGHPNLFMTGGGCGHARFFPRLIALQILQAQLGQPVQPFKETKLKVPGE